MDLNELDRALSERREPRFRAAQVWQWLARGAGSYAEMTNLPAALREQLADEVPISTLECQRELSASDGTVKALFATADGRPLEAVLMRYRDGRRSLCLSSQSGCPLTCTFCATGSMRFGRNLHRDEILDQALHFRRGGAAVDGPAEEAGAGGAGRSTAPGWRRITSEGGAGRPTELTHCVFMGMGEPMLNLDNVLAACERLPDLGITHRRTAISTVGWIPGIERLAECDMPLRLALSLHAAEDDLRTQLMPVNERYPLADVLDACRAYHARKRRRVFVEYVMLAGVNDRYAQALALARALNPRGADERPPFKVNLIPYNPTGDRYEGSSRGAIAAFRDALLARGVPATIRLTRGRDIDAACGQLAAREAVSPA